MSLRLVSSNDLRALAIRDHLLPVVRERGTLECQRDAVRRSRCTWNVAAQALDAVQRPVAGPGSLAGLPPRPGSATHPAGAALRLEVWREDDKVLSVLWAEDGSHEVDSFVRGSWEDEALAL